MRFAKYLDNNYNEKGMLYSKETSIPENAYLREKIVNDWCLFLGGLALQGIGIAFEKPVVAITGGTIVLASGVLLTRHTDRHEKAIINQKIERIHER